MFLKEVLQLSLQEAGVVLFSNEFALSRGAMACRDFFVYDFCEEKDMGSLLCEGAPKAYVEVLEMVQQLLQDMVKGLTLADWLGFAVLFGVTVSLFLAKYWDEGITLQVPDTVRVQVPK